MSKLSNCPVYFTKLVLENIRSFSERQELKLVDNNDRPAPWTLIVGDNGVGKTTLLQCIARMRPVFNPDDENSSPTPNPVEPELASEEDNDVLDALVRSVADTRACLKAQLSFGQPLTGRRRPGRGSISTSLKITRTEGRITGFETDGNFSKRTKKRIDEPLVLAYGAGRHPKTINTNKVSMIDPVGSLFEAATALHDAEDLLYRLEFGSMKGDPIVKERLGSLRRMLVEILPDVDCPQDIEILGPPGSVAPPGRTGIHVKTPYGNVPLGQLSLGYQTVFAWTIDIAWRLLERYPNSPNPLREPAIVIVDEIDLHLHPLWQRNIRGHLTGHFPNVQFVATAHSPLMAQISLDTNLAVLRKSGDHALILNEPAIIKDWRLDQVITSDLFDLSSARSPDVEKILMRRQELVEKRELSDMEQSELAELDNRVRELPTADSSKDQSAMEIIRRAAANLQSNRETS